MFDCHLEPQFGSSFKISREPKDFIVIVMTLSVQNGILETGE